MMPDKWATNRAGAWNVTRAIELCERGEAGPVRALPFLSVWTPSRRAQELSPERLASLAREPDWRTRPLLFVTHGDVMGIPAVYMVDGAHRLRLWSRERPATVPAYILPPEQSRSVMIREEELT